MIDAAIAQHFHDKTFWIKAEITDVKKQENKNWCFFKLLEKENKNIVAEIRAVMWSNAFKQIAIFEKETHQKFESGLEISCCVNVRFNKRFGLDLEVIALDFAYTIGKIELERKETLAKLLRNNKIKLLADGSYASPNNSEHLPNIIKKIAFITAPNSDGQRDFLKVMGNNSYGYTFYIHNFGTQVQGDAAPKKIITQLNELIDTNYDAIVIARGGGSDTDFKTFNDYDLCEVIANFKIPILTGIGHDRNTSIADLMARQKRTPTDVANFICAHNYNFEYDVMQKVQKINHFWKQRLQQISQNLHHLKRTIKNLDPENTLKKGFAIIYQEKKIVTKHTALNTNAALIIQMADCEIETQINKTNERKR